MFAGWKQAGLCWVVTAALAVVPATQAENKIPHLTLAERRANFKSTIELGRTAVHPYEPLNILLRLSHDGNQPHAHGGPWPNRPQYVKDGRLTYYFRPSERTVSEIGDPSIVHLLFKPGETLTVHWSIGPLREGEHLYSSEGRIELAGVFAGVTSATEWITVQPIKESEVAALRDYVKQKLYRYASAQDAAHALPTDWDADREEQLAKGQQALEALKAFVKKHPDSRYADWAKLGDLLVRQDLEKRYDFKRSFGITKTMLLTQGPASVPAAQSEYWFQAGRYALLVLKDAATAEVLWQRAQDLGVDKTLEYQIVMARRYAAWKRGEVDTPFPPPK